MPLFNAVVIAVAAQLGAQLGTSATPVHSDGLRATVLAWYAFKRPVTFKKQEREVTNWRSEAMSRIDTPFEVALSTFTGQPPASLPRCIKLNNYWCIKRAGWAGEIASDNEGHVAFASASEGAQTAALLLRRYYVDFGRRSAYAIVSRWAPANCGYLAQMGRATRRGSKFMSRIARGGLANTLRGRWLTAHGGRVVGGRGASPIRPSIVPNYSVAMLRAPSIEAGVSEVPAAVASFNTANLSLLDPAPAATSRLASGLRAAPVFSCAAENQRINNYAVRASAGITANVNDDLELFTPDGNPRPNLEKIMYNMSSVEIGPWKVDRTLIQSAIVKANEARILLQASRREAAKALREAAAGASRKSSGPAPQDVQPKPASVPSGNAAAERPAATTR